MNSRQRMLAALQGGIPDRLPVTTHHLTWMLALASTVRLPVAFRSTLPLAVTVLIPTTSIVAALAIMLPTPALRSLIGDRPDGPPGTRSTRSARSPRTHGIRSAAGPGSPSDGPALHDATDGRGVHGWQTTMPRGAPVKYASAPVQPTRHRVVGQSTHRLDRAVDRSTPS